MASELSYFSDSINRDTLVLAVSQSGETADINHNINMVKKNGARLISIVNTPGSSLCRASDRVHYMGCGPEVSVAATKTFISELVILYLLAHAMAGKYEQGIAEILSVPKANYEVGHITHRLAGNRDAYYIGRGINFALAGEAALKLKEISYIHAEGMPAGELKHGTLSLVEKGTPVIGICPNDYTYDEMISNLHEAKSRGAWIVGISDRNNDVFEDWVRIPEVPELYYPLVSVVPAQLIAYHTAIARGLNPDRPRNLAKSVTVR
jgi:glucosamine--fructose-6-phosphate aminotransferase (isomerizing)